MPTQFNQIELRIDFRILEGIRGIAAFIVLLNHARGNLFIGGKAYLASLPNAGLIDWTAVALMQLTALGPQAVIVFFVLSGFSIAHSIENSTTIAGFYKKRFIRLYPPFLGGLFLAWVTYIIFSFASPIPGIPPLSSVFRDAMSIIGNLLYLPSGSFIPQYWSLSHEVIFYAIAPFAVVRTRRTAFLVISLVMYLYGLTMSPTNGENSDIPRRFLFDYCIYFAIGVVSYNNFAKLTVFLSLPKKYFYLVSTIFTILLIAIMQISEKASFLIAAIFSIFIIVNFLTHRIDNSFISYLGKSSYTLYVTHFAAIYLWLQILHSFGYVNGLPINSPWLWITSIPFSLLISSIFFFLFERPAVRILSGIRERATTALNSAPIKTNK